jgi:hypothetical protein
VNILVTGGTGPEIADLKALAEQWLASRRDNRMLVNEYLADRYATS